MAQGEQPDESQKTEEPTPKKLEDSKKKGQVALSREVNNWMMLFAGTILVAAISPFMFSELGNFLRVFIEQPHEISTSGRGLSALYQESFGRVLMIIGLPLLFFVVMAITGPFLQIGPLFAPEVLKPSFDKVSVIKGFKRIFSQRALVEFAKGVVKLVVVGVVTFFIVKPYYGGLESLMDMPLDAVVFEIKALVIRVMIGVLVILFVVAMMDYAFQRMEHYKKMRMTKQEVKDEYKTTEGDPHVKARLRQLRQEKASARIMQAVPEADVVITNPTHYAVALKYDPEEMQAPMCVAKGVNEVALRIRDLAKELDIVVQENPPLARALYDSVEMDEAIPVEHFEAVAKVISYVFQTKGRSVKKPT